MLFEQEIAAQQERAQDAIAQVLAEWKSLRRLSGEVRQRKELSRRSARTKLVSELLILTGFRRKYLFKLGADASVAAGPVGRQVEGMTDWTMRAEVLTYSRARGVFAGISLNGASIRQHKDDTRAFYGRMVPFRTLLTGNLTPAPKEAYPWLAALKKYAPTATASTATPVPPAR
jgi:hypothetical protein